MCMSVGINTNKRHVECLECGYEWMSKAVEPQCTQEGCRSHNVNVKSPDDGEETDENAQEEDQSGNGKNSEEVDNESSEGAEEGDDPEGSPDHEENEQALEQENTEPDDSDMVSSDEYRQWQEREKHQSDPSDDTPTVPGGSEIEAFGLSFSTTTIVVAALAAGALFYLVYRRRNGSGGGGETPEATTEAPEPETVETEERATGNDIDPAELDGPNRQFAEQIGETPKPKRREDIELMG